MPRHTAIGLLAGATAIAVVSAVIAVLKQWVQGIPDGLTGLYLFAILPVAIVWGFWLAGIVAIASYLTYAFFFAAAVHHLAVGEGDSAASLLIAIAAAYVVSELARRATERAREAEQAQSETRSAGRRAGRVAAHRHAGGAGGADLRGPSRPSLARSGCGATPTSRAWSASRPPIDTVTALAAWSRTGDAQLAVGTRFGTRGHEHRGAGERDPAGRLVWTRSRERRDRSLRRRTSWASSRRSAARSSLAAGRGA